MSAYPSVNWWPGNLRPYESRLSFLARFSELNGVNVRACLKFFQVDLEENTPLPESQIVRISFILNETLSLVRGVFSPPLNFSDCGSYAPPAAVRDRHFIRYCEKCAHYGYHSYLHDVSWLSQCPFHLTELKSALVEIHAKPIAVQHLEALKYVMRVCCKGWPHGSSGSFPELRQAHIESLVDWVTRARSVAASLSQGEIWRSGDGAYLGDLSPAQAIGQLRTLAPMPTNIEPLFREHDCTWRMESRQFARQARLEFERLGEHHLSFARVFDFYKTLSAHLPNPPSFVVRLRAVQDVLKSRHGSCHCRWGLVYGGWNNWHWILVHPDEWPHEGCTCPFEAARAELELGWGRFEQVSSRRQEDEENFRLFTLSNEMHDAGLISYTKDAAVRPDGFLYIDQDLWSCCEWRQDSSLTDLFEMAAAWEVESAFSAQIAWLDSIERGIRPSERNDPKYCVRLRATEEGLSLVRWTKMAPDEMPGESNNTRRSP
ncbi:hypothetical protein [Burkholderia ubonensis]|uniref:hypothetical protein n=1 Tax=Burkholderia ubonensis TaxID=101571 RepID=UPI0009B52A33|nr:hypothetical protein [Burkholderia ubonensis]